MATIPMIGDRVERRFAGVSQSGTVHYADQLQVLVKWDDGSSSSLRVGIHHFKVVKREAEPQPEAAVTTA